jgi:hypothetical protein
LSIWKVSIFPKSLNQVLYRILGLLYKRALFDLQFVHNLFWLKLKWNARSKLFHCRGIIPPCFDEVQLHWQKCRNGTIGNLWFVHLSRRTTVIQDLLVRRQFSLLPDNRTNVNVEVWPDFIKSLYASIPRRVRQVLRANGCITKYWRNGASTCTFSINRAGTTDKSISTGIKYWVCCIKGPCLISNLSIIYFD